MDTISRCDIGKALVKEYTDNYNKVVAESGDWMKAFYNPIYHNHKAICSQCQDYEAARRVMRYAVKQEWELEAEAQAAEDADAYQTPLNSLGTLY